MKTKKVKSSGRFKARYGKRIREIIAKVEKKQRKKQKCPYCKKSSLKKLSKGIWYCKKCKKKFTSNVYYIE